MALSSSYRAPSVARALKILQLVADSNQGLGISELARRLGISKGTVSGICTQLEAGGALVRGQQSKRYSLGPVITALASRGSVYTRLKDVAGPELTRLRDELNESFFLGVATRDRITVVDTRQPAGVIGISAGPGTRLPLTAGATGKVFLAGLPPQALERFLASGLPAHTPHSVTDPEQFKRQLHQVRTQGYALEQDEYLLGVWGVAVALGSEAGLPAALWSIGFTSAAKAGAQEKIARALIGASRRINQILAKA
ncbi:MAG: IclR family transcriptional regulator [Desulfarculaceae bacterium]|jgi:DNA-binding IclR family transcriptional regulator